MRILNYKKMIKTLLIIGIVACATGQCAFGDANPIDIQMSLTNPSNITQGEPIVLHYEIVNPTELSSNIQVGANQSEWYTISLSGNKGKSIVASPYTTLKNDEPTSYGPLRIVGAHMTLKDDIVLTRYFGDLSPGKYTLNVHVQLPYAMKSPLDVASAGQSLKSTDPLLTHNFVFPINVAPVDVIHIRSVAESLQKQYAEERSGTHATTLLRELFSMPEAQAAPSWIVCANNPKMDAGFIAIQLAGRRSAIAADILANMLRSPSLSSDERAAVNRNLNEMYNASDPTVKAHIKNIAGSFGIPMPDKVAIPIHSD